MIDINSRGQWPANVLSNLWANSFIMDDVVFGSIEGFLQGLREKDPAKQLILFSKSGIDAKRSGRAIPIKDQTLYWKGKPFSRHSDCYRSLYTRAYLKCFAQNELFQKALAATIGKTLTHSIGKSDPFDTILTEQEFIFALNYVRSKFELYLKEML
jgi:hypothetical protein